MIHLRNVFDPYQIIYSLIHVRCVLDMHPCYGHFSHLKICHAHHVQTQPQLPHLKYCYSVEER